MKKLLSLMVTLALCLSLVACGGSKGRADEALVGNYIAVTGTALGVTLSGDDVAGFSLELKNGGKATMSIEDTNVNGKWTNDDTTVTITVQGTDMVGQLGENTITFESFLEKYVGTSMDVKFAKEGTDATSPENFLPDEEKALLGDWTGVSVTNVSDEDVSGEVSPDALKVTLNADHTSVVTYNGEELGTPTWSYFSNNVMFDGDLAGGVNLYAESKDGTFVITYSGDNYYNFTMAK